jgi:hypothetical protein
MNYLLQNNDTNEIIKPIHRRKSLIKDGNLYVIEKINNCTKIEYEYAWYSEKIKNIINIYNNEGLKLGFIKINSLKNKCKVYDINNKLIFKYYCKKKLFNKSIKYIKIPIDSPQCCESKLNDVEIINSCNGMYYPTPDKIYNSAKNIKFIRNNTIQKNLPSFMSTSELTVEKLTDKAHKILAFKENTNSHFIFQITRNYFKELPAKSNYYTVLHNSFLDLYSSYALALCCLYIY